VLPWPVPRDHPLAKRRSADVDAAQHERSHEDDPPAFAVLYRKETPWLIRFFRRRVGNIDEAHDLAHEAIVRYLKAAPCAAISSPQAYLRRVAANLLRDRAERGSTRLSAITMPLIEGLDAIDSDDPHRTLEAREELGRWTAILCRLPSLTLEAFLLSRVDGFTYNEIADHLGISVWSVKRHMAKAIGHMDQHRSGLP
jgi:RNA polymerase sigma-70 factor (ECF subfamily)